MAARKKISDQTQEAVSTEALPSEPASADPGPPSAEGVLRDTQTVVREALKNGDHRTALKGLEMLGKHFGLFDDRSDPGQGTSGQVHIYHLPDNGRDPPPTDAAQPVGKRGRAG